MEITLIWFLLCVFFQDLPAEFQAKLTKAGLSLEECEKNLAATLSILHFLYKRKFKLRKVKPALAPAEPEKSETGDGETFEVTVQAEVLEGPEEVVVAPAALVDSAPIAVSDEMTLDDLAREARSITEGDPLTHFTKFVSHGQGCVLFRDISM